MERFPSAGDKVKVMIVPRSRAVRLEAGVPASCSSPRRSGDLATVESMPRQDGRNMIDGAISPSARPTF